MSFGAINHGFFTVSPSLGNAGKKKNTQPFLSPKKKLITLSLRNGFSDITFPALAN